MTDSRRKRFLWGATLGHRRAVWEWARDGGRWPSSEQWRFILLGRWKGF